MQSSIYSSTLLTKVAKINLNLQLIDNIYPERMTFILLSHKSYGLSTVAGTGN